MNMLSNVASWDLVAAGYCATTMKLFSPYAEAAISVCQLTPESCVLDLACGPGTVALKIAKQVQAVHGIDFSRAMLDQCQQQLFAQNIHNVVLHHGDAQQLPYATESFDTVISLFGLMFFPNRTQALAEVFRTLKPKGRVVLTSWAPISQSPAMQLMFGAIKAIKPDLPEPQRDISSLENPAVFARELSAAGFSEVRVVPLCLAAFPVESVTAFWQSMVQGSAPIQMLKQALGEAAWREKEPLALQYLAQNLPTLPTTLSSDAWLGVGIKL